LVVFRSFASINFPLVDSSNPADARPAILVHLGEVFHAVKICGHISTFLMGGLLADWVGFVDVIDATNLKVMGAFSCFETEGKGYCEES